MDRQEYYEDQIVDPPDLNELQDNVESADRRLVLDHLGVGIATGLTFSEQATPDLTLQLSQGAAYDALGRRVEVPSVQTVNLAGNEPSSGAERFEAVYLRAKRTELDPYTSTGGGTGYFSQRETFEILVVEGAEAPSGTAAPPAAPSGNPVLLGRVLRTHGQTALYTRDVNLSGVTRARRAQDLYSASPERRLECTPTEPPSLSVRVAGGTVSLDGTAVAVAAGTSPLVSAPSTNSRIDLVYVDASGSLAVRPGTEAASPVRPTVRGVLPVAFLHLGVGQLALEASHIEDARPWLQAETSVNRVFRLVASGGETLVTLPWSYTPGAHALLLTVDGVAQDETQYAETDASSVTLGGALTAGQVLVVRATDVQPLSAVTLAQVTDDLSGLLVGGDEITVENRGSGIRIYVSPIQVCVLGKTRYNTPGESTVHPGALLASTWYYLYAYASGGALAFEVSNTAPVNRLWKSGDTSRRYLATVRSGSGSTLLLSRSVRGRVRYSLSAMAALSTLALSAGTAATWTTVDLSGLVPPHARLAELTAEFQGTTDPALGELRTYGGSTTAASIMAAAGISSASRLGVETDASQRIEYQVSNGTLYLVGLGWDE